MREHLIGTVKYNEYSIKQFVNAFLSDFGRDVDGSASVPPTYSFFIFTFLQDFMASHV